MRYTYSDEDEDDSEAPNRRSFRNTGTNTPADAPVPTVTLSGRQVRSRHGGMYGETVISGTHMPNLVIGEHDGSGVNDEDEDIDITSRRPRRAVASNGANGRRQGDRHIDGYNSLDELDEDDDASEQDYGDDEEDEHVPVESDPDDVDDEDDVLMGNEDEMDVDEIGSRGKKKTLVVKLSIRTPTPEKTDRFTGADTLYREATQATEVTDPMVPLQLEVVTQPGITNPLEENGAASNARPEAQAITEAANGNGPSGSQSATSEDKEPSGAQSIHLPASHSLPYLNGHGSNYPYSPSIDIDSGRV